MIYKYSASKTDKTISEGTVEAASEKMAEEALYQAGFKYVLNLKTRQAPLNIYRLLPTLFGVKTPDIIDFSRHLAAFIESGSSLHSALELLKEQSSKPSLKMVISEIIEQLEGGKSFSQTIKDHPDVFPHSYWQVVQSSEKAGELEKGLVQIAEYLENRAQMTDKIRRSLAYPIFVICLAIGVVVLLATTVLPPIVKLFSSFQADLPPTTVFAIKTMNFFSAYKVIILIGILSVTAILALLSRSPSGKNILDRFALGVPVFGPIIVNQCLGRFCRTASMLLKAGLPLPNIMDVTIQTLGNNRVINRSLTVLKEKLMQGEGLAKPMSEDSLFPASMIKMVMVGEQTGTLESSLETLATYYEGRTNKRIQSLIGLIEPGLTVAIGLGIAFIMYSMIIPIYTIINQVR